MIGRRLRACFIVTGAMGAVVLCFAFVFIPLQPALETDQIFSSLPPSAGTGQDRKANVEQVMKALRSGEHRRMALVAGVGLLLLGASRYGYLQAKKMSEAEPSDKQNDGERPGRLP